jgi:hypothetical protein
MFNTAIPALIILVTMLAFFFHDMMWGPLAALTAEVFTPRLRYSGASMGFQLASLFAGGPAPMIATALLAATGSGMSSRSTSSVAPSPASSRRLCCRALVSWILHANTPELPAKPKRQPMVRLGGALLRLLQRQNAWGGGAVPPWHGHTGTHYDSVTADRNFLWG